MLLCAVGRNGVSVGQQTWFDVTQGRDESAPNQQHSENRETDQLAPLVGRKSATRREPNAAAVGEITRQQVQVD
jgi:hypothetical protein